MRIAIIGYGKMGKEIETRAKELGHEITHIFDVHNIEELKNLKSDETDVAIEFSRPDTAPDNIKTCLKNGIQIVTGTTGWNDSLEEITSYCKENNACLFYASNFSIGMNIFFEINKILAKLMSSQQAYNAKMQETHHIHKLDAPSGTAVSLAMQIIENHPNYVKWVLNNDESISNLPIFAFREGEVPGDHSVKWDSEWDNITISHSAKNRKGFVNGAIMAAEFVIGKTGVYQMKDLLNL
ncbi:MAG: 4-hydroxy-tetrahydrodipicolinate reductase [Bacteroidales bacterium]|nr:4-hydroxy-tetrahydrodipicolinate reductase [Bacteroidales bacterium]